MPRKKKTKTEDVIQKPDGLKVSHGYFQGHECHLPAEKISAYGINSRGVKKWFFNLICVHAGDIRAVNMHRSYAALCAEKFRHHEKYFYTIHPYSKLRFYLEILFVVAMTVGTVLLAYNNGTTHPDNDDDFHDELIMLCNSMIFVNIIANFLTGYIEGHSRKIAILAKDKIGLKYLKSWLIADVIACVGNPMDAFLSSVSAQLVLEAVKLIRLPIILIYLHNILIVMRCTIFLFHFALKYILALFGKESARAQYYMMKNQLKTYMVQRNFPPRLKSKILKFYAIRFQYKYFEESRMLGCVSGQLREDILMHTGRQLVRELNFLKQLPSSLLVQIAFKLRVVIYIAGDIIFKINTVGDCLYFIDRGTVAIYSDSGKEICHLEDGDFFGEIALVMKHHFRTASAIAVTNCELFRLDKEHFETTIGYYPTVYNSIKEVAISRFERTCVLDEHHKAELRTAENSLPV
uniref:Cyclic nucleotide-binding domain-containing protein n=1 Tax=Heliothis virescens TaxID=7102 RepID=A0A2A4J7Z5_HELVI